MPFSNFFIFENDFEHIQCMLKKHITQLRKQLYLNFVMLTLIYFNSFMFNLWGVWFVLRFFPNRRTATYGPVRRARIAAKKQAKKAANRKSCEKPLAVQAQLFRSLFAQTAFWLVNSQGHFTGFLHWSPRVLEQSTNLWIFFTMTPWQEVLVNAVK